MRVLFALCTVLAGLILTSPYHNFQDFMATGDHGRDLYAAQAVLRGELPYKDFWWVYGPLMPYYYGIFYKIFGVKVTSILLGKTVLVIASGAFVYLALAALISPLTAFLGALWFIQFHQDFFFTYNHAGGLAFMLAIVWMTLSYLKNPKPRYLFWALFVIYVLGLIKVNFAISSLVSLMIAVGVIDWRRTAGGCRSGDPGRPERQGVDGDDKLPHGGMGAVRTAGVIRQTGPARRIFWTLALAGVPLLIFLSYLPFVQGLSAMEIRQCLPYLGDDQPYNTSPWIALYNFFINVFNNIRANDTNLAFAIIVQLSLVQTIYLMVTRKIDQARRQTLLMALGILAVFYVLGFHEYLKSGVWYRAFWVQPIGMMLTFILIATAVEKLPKMIRFLLWSLIGILILLSFRTTAQHADAYKVPQQQLTGERGGVYLSNNPQWIQTVHEATQYLKTTLQPGELFFALPYDCLYYYLTDTKSPTRQMIFFEHIKIPPEQEQSVLAELEHHQVKYILLSSRSYARAEHGLGILGVTYCPLIGKYIKDNFTPMAQFGDWQNEPGWAWNHGVVILKHK